MKSLIAIMIFISSSLVFAEDCNIFIHGYTRKSEGYFADLPRQVLWDSGLEIEKAAPLIAQGILKEIKTCAENSTIVLRPHSYGSAVVYYIVGQGRRLQKLFPNHPFVQVFQKTMYVLSYTGAFHGTNMIDLVCDNEALEEMGDWLNKPCVQSLSSLHTFNVSYHITSPGVPIFLMASANSSAWLGTSGALIGKYGVEYEDYNKGKRNLNDNTLPLFAAFACASPVPMLSLNETCKKIDANFFIDLFLETRYGHLDFRKIKSYMTCTIEDFTNDLNGARYDGPFSPLEIYQNVSNYSYTNIPIDASKMEDPILRHFFQKPLWKMPISGHGLQARFRSLKETYSTETEATFLLDFTWNGKPTVGTATGVLLDENRKQIATVYFNSKKPNPLEAKIPLTKLKDGNYTLQGTLISNLAKMVVSKSFTVLKNPPLYKGTKKVLARAKDITIPTQWDIPKDGLYLIEATLQDQNAKPLISFDEVRYLKKGSNDIAISFDGYYFYSHKLSGPFTLSTLSVSPMNDSNFLVSRPQPTAVNFQTEAMKWNEFSSTPKIDPTYKKKIEFLKKH